MRFIATLVVAALLCSVAAWWFASPKDESNATQAAAVSSGFDSRQPVDGNGETPQQQRSGKPGVPAEEWAAHRDAGSDSAMSTSTVGVTLVAREAEHPTAGNAAETIPGQATDVPSVEPSAIDKTACEAAAKALNESLSIYDVTPTQAICYATPRPTDPLQVNAFTELKARLLAPLCSGTDAFDRAYPVESEFVAISPEAHVKILVGDHWISDGTVLSFLSERDQYFFKGALQARRIGPGPNTSRASFERQLARNPQALIPER
jgi:hypothetical protein